jgi:hypothetical protein
VAVSTTVVVSTVPDPIVVSPGSCAEAGAAHTTSARSAATSVLPARPKSCLACTGDGRDSSREAVQARAAPRGGNPLLNVPVADRPNTCRRATRRLRITLASPQIARQKHRNLRISSCRPRQTSPQNAASPHRQVVYARSSAAVVFRDRRARLASKLRHLADMSAVLTRPLPRSCPGTRNSASGLSPAWMSNA